MLMLMLMLMLVIKLKHYKVLHMIPSNTKIVIVYLAGRRTLAPPERKKICTLLLVKRGI